MIEEHVVRQIVHPHPRNRLPRRPAVPHRLQQLRIRPDLRMAVHARLRRGNPRVAGLLHRRVAVLALQPQSLHVMLVAERHRLIRPLPLPRHPRRPLQFIGGQRQGNHNQSRQNQAHPGQRVRTAVKNLRHECVLRLLSFSESMNRCGSMAGCSNRRLQFCRRQQQLAMDVQQLSPKLPHCIPAPETRLTGRAFALGSS